MRERGVTLVEALVSMVVVAFGLVAMARLQLGMAHGSDTARSRSEATQHARAMAEELRGRAYADLDGGADTPGSAAHTAYLRRWSVGGSAADVLRPVEIVVEWTDRRGELQEVVLRSAIARADPADGGGALLAATEPGGWLQPAGRHHAVPRNSKITTQGVGSPTLAWSGSAGAVLVFDAASSMVVQACSAGSQDGDGPTNCKSFAGYLLEGYVAGQNLGSLQMVFDRTAGGADPECVWSGVDDPQTGRTVAGVRRYRCLLPATDEDNDDKTTPTWSGRARLAGVQPPGATACRYTPAADASANADHPETYTGIAASLDHQNFVIVDGGDCPPGAVPHPPA